MLGFGVHASLNFLDRRPRWSERGGSGAVGGNPSIKSGEFLLGQEALFFEADFATTFVAVPKDKEED